MSLKHEARILEYLRRGMHISDILSREGLDPGNDRKKIKALAGQHGLKVVEGPRSIDDTPQLPFINVGTTIRLGWFLKELAEKHEKDELGALTGMTAVERSRAVKGKHDWTISQLARVGKLFGMQPGVMLMRTEDENLARHRALNMEIQAYRKESKE